MALSRTIRAIPRQGLSGGSKLTWGLQGRRETGLSSERLSVVYVLAPAPAGGLERVVRTLAGGLSRRGHRVTVITVITPDQEPHAYVEALRSDGLDVEAVVLGSRSYLAERRAVAQVLSSRQAAILHTHGYRADLVDAGVGRRRKLATVSTLHGFIGGGWRGRLYERLQVLNLRRLSAVIAVSAPLGELVSKAGVKAERLHVIPNAWSGEAPYSREAARDQLGLPRDAWVVGWVGRLSREKGPDVMLRALVRLRNDMLLSMVGEGPMGQVLRAQATDAGLEHRVRWHGPVPDAGRLMTAFDALVLSSRTEGTPMVALEAMAAGVPLLVTRVGGLPHVVGTEGGIVVEPEDPQALARGIEALREDTARSAGFAAAARRRLHDEFGLEAWLDRHETIYRLLATSR